MAPGNNVKDKVSYASPLNLISSVAQPSRCHFCGRRALFIVPFVPKVPVCLTNLQHFGIQEN